jgi:deazaflavin-dependent oxidoreductase (nitroreductase family)
MSLRRALARRLGQTRLGVLAIKHVIAPLDRFLYGFSGGRIVSSGTPLFPTLLLTTAPEEEEGKANTAALLYHRDGERLIVANANPGFENPPTWVRGLRQHAAGIVQLGRTRTQYSARMARKREIERYWPFLVELWPAYETHRQRTGEYCVFVLEPEDE